MSVAVSTENLEAKRILHVQGEVDVSNAPSLRDAIDEALASGATEVEVDLAEVPYIDSTGIGVLVGAAHRASDAGVAFRASNPQRNVGRVLAMLDVTDALGVND